MIENLSTYNLLCRKFAAVCPKLQLPDPILLTHDTAACVLVIV